MFSNDPGIVMIIVIISIIIQHINVNIYNGGYLQISGVRGSNVDIAPVFLPPGSSLVGLHILLDWLARLPPPPPQIRFVIHNFQATQTYTTGWSLAGSTLSRSLLANLTLTKFNTLTITELFIRLR